MRMSCPSCASRPRVPMSSAMLGLTLFALMMLPVILATRAWYKARQKDSSA